MKRLYVFGIVVAMVAIGFAQPSPLLRSTPEAQGIPSQAIVNLVDSFMNFPKTDLHSLVVVRNGNVVAEVYPAPFHAESGQQMYSCSKTFSALAAGLAIADNLLRVDDRIAVFYPEMLPDSIPDALADVTVEQLMTMQSGIEVDWGMRSKRDDWMRGYLAKPVVAEPGTKFAYDSMSSYMLAAIVQRVTGRTLIDILRERIFEPMEITDAQWEISPEGINCGGWGIWMKPESLAKIGMLFLQKGRWNGEQLVPEEWIEEMTKMRVDQCLPDLDNYCYQIWTCSRPDSRRLDGAMGQFVYIIPDKDMVVVVTQSFTGNYQESRREHSWLWDGLMPSVGDNPLPPSKAYSRLQRKISEATLPLARGKASSPMAHMLSDSPIALDNNDMGWSCISFDFNSKVPEIIIADRKGNVSRMPMGYRKWLTTKIEHAPANSMHTVHGALDGLDIDFEASTSYGWLDKNTLEVRIYYSNWGSATFLTVELAPDGTPTVKAANNWAPTSPKIVTHKD